MSNQDALKIGILNLMHDKVDTQKRFTHVLQQTGKQVELTYFYPVDHYQDKPVPELVSAISEPLDLKRVARLDAFIVTGAPIEQIDFNEVTYIAELQALFDCLNTNHIEQLYVCWGAMAAANYFYGIDKYLLKNKLFGIYPQLILEENPLLAGLDQGFLAPHARYAELDLQQVQTSTLHVLATTVQNELFLAENQKQHQTYLFSHLEYEKEALLKEYQRELAANPKKMNQLAKPQNYFKDERAMQQPLFSWQQAQECFFANWMQTVCKSKMNKFANEQC